MKIRIDPLDQLFSKYIRLRAMAEVGGCERCLQSKIDYKGLQCSHYHKRRKKSVRWDEDNCNGFCFGCHQYFEENQDEYTAWIKQHLGEREFDMLLGRMRVSARYIDKEAIRLYYKAKIEEILKESNKVP